MSILSEKSSKNDSKIRYEDDGQATAKKSSKTRVTFNLSLFDPHSSADLSPMNSTLGKTNSDKNANNNNNNNNSNPSVSQSFTQLDSENSSGNTSRSNKKWFEILQDTSDKSSLPSSSASISQGPLQLSSNDSAMDTTIASTISSTSSTSIKNRKVASTKKPEAITKTKLINRPKEDYSFHTLSSSSPSLLASKNVSSPSQQDTSQLKDMKLYENRSECTLNTASSTAYDRMMSSYFSDILSVRKNELDAYSKTSILDEPELSFVSINTQSMSASPSKEVSSTPALQQNLFRNSIKAYLTHQNELFKKFNDVSPIETNKATLNQSTAQNFTELSDENETILKKSSRLINNKSTEFTQLTNTNQNLTIMNFSLEPQTLEQSTLENSQIKLNRNDSILNSSQLDQLINNSTNDAKNTTITPTNFYNENEYDTRELRSLCKSDSLISFERHEKSALENQSLSLTASPTTPSQEQSPISKWNSNDNHTIISQWRVAGSEKSASESNVSTVRSYTQHQPMNSTPMISDTFTTTSRLFSSNNTNMDVNFTNYFETLEIGENSFTTLSPFIENKASQSSVSDIYLFGFCF
jgi:hypothetical protein